MRILGGNALAASMSSLPTRSWAERHAPWVFSLCLHLLLVVSLVAAPTLPALRNVKPKTVQVRLVLKPPEERAKGETKAEPELVVQPARATSSAPQPETPAPESSPARAETVTEPQPDRANPAGEQTEPKVAEAIESIEKPSVRKIVDPAALKAEQERRIEDILIAYGKKASQGRSERHDEMKNIAARLEKASTAAAASKAFPDYEGARVGAVRTFSDTGVDPKIAEQVKRRYDIHITTRFLSRPSGLSYLNSVASGGSVYHPADKPGYYEVFEISEKAYRQMVVLENEWMVSHGYDPGRTCVDSVEFGIVERRSGFWDLGIVKIKVQESTALGQPTTAKPMAN